MERDSKRRKRRLVLLLTLTPALFVTLYFVVLALVPPTFEASGLATVDVASLESARQGYHSKRDLATELALMTSNLFLESTLRQMTAEDRRDLLGKAARRKLTPAEADALLVQRLARGLDVDMLHGSNLLEFTFSDRQPRVAAMVVNHAMQTAATLGAIMALRRQDQAKVFFAPRLEELQARIADLRRQERALGPGHFDYSFELRFREQSTAVVNIGSGQGGSGSFGKRHAKLLRRSASVQNTEIHPEERETDPALPVLAGAATKAELGNLLAQSQSNLLGILTAEDPHAFEAQYATFELRTLQKHLDEAQTDYAALAATLGPQQPEMLRRRAEIQQLGDSLNQQAVLRLRSVQADATRTAFTVAALKQALRRQTAEQSKALARAAQEQTLALDLALNLSLYEDLRDRLLNERITGSLNAVRIAVVDPAALPTEPNPVGSRIQFVAVTLLGFFVGLAIASPGVIRSLQLWPPGTLEATAHLQALAYFPLQPADDPAVREEIDAGLTAVRQLLASTPAARTLLLTSGRHGEGTGTVARELATALAAHGSRVLLLHTDMHSGAPYPGLSTILQGHCTFDSALQPTPHFDELPAGPPTSFASTLVASPRLPELLRSLAPRYDFVLLLAPPVFAYSDTESLAHTSDLTFLIAGYGHSSARDIASAAWRLHASGSILAGLLAVGVPAT